MTATDGSRAEAERQLAAASARHREAVATMVGSAGPKPVNACRSGRSAGPCTLSRFTVRRGADASAVAQAAAGSDAIISLGEFTQRMRADVDRDLTAEAPSAADRDDLRDRLDTAWSAWRESLGRREA